jgi:F-type H+-transporting ATPase subunit a
MDHISVVFRIGPIAVTSTVVTTWGIMFTLGVFSWLATRRLAAEPGQLQTLLEGAVTAIDEAVRNMLPQHGPMVLPFVGTLWIYILAANLTGLIPGLDSPTGDLSVTAGLAILVFLSVHWFGIRADGLRAYLRHYLSPTPIMLPFQVIGEISRTLALAVRLFGNIMSLEMAALLVLVVAGPLVPVPLLMLHIVEALVQAYIFGMLALVYISGGIQSQRTVKDRKEGVVHE